MQRDANIFACLKLSLSLFIFTQPFYFYFSEKKDENKVKRTKDVNHASDGTDRKKWVSEVGTMGGRSPIIDMLLYLKIWTRSKNYQQIRTILQLKWTKMDLKRLARHEPRRFRLRFSRSIYPWLMFRILNIILQYKYACTYMIISIHNHQKDQ